MTTTLEQLQAWMDGREDEHVEFKEAKAQYSLDALVDYCVALANEGGGRLIMGVSNLKPRQVVGSRAFGNLQDTKVKVLEQVHFRVDAEELFHPAGRVVVFVVPPRPQGVPLHHNGQYWMRAGESLVPMTPERLRSIFAEASPDFSAELCKGATLGDLDEQAVERFRQRWQRRTRRSDLSGLSPEQLLADAELLVSRQLTYAALILLGTPGALNRYLPDSEVVFEYRSSEASGPAQQRLEYRRAFFSYDDELWILLNQRNDLQHFQQGFVMIDVATFNEAVVREAILNAVSHRDYRMAGSTFVVQYPRRLVVSSPGGFPTGITLDNILYWQVPRNRRIAETFGRCGLVERAGQGMNRMFEDCVRESKPLPDFAGTDAHHVVVTLHGQVQDPRFIQYLQKVSQAQLALFSTDDFLVLDLVRREERIPERLRDRARWLVDHGVIESVSRGRGQRFVLSRGLYGAIGEPGAYTRRRGLDRPASKELLLNHMRDSGDTGSPLSELQQVVPYLSRYQVQGLLRELKRAGVIQPLGRTRSARWHIKRAS